MLNTKRRIQIYLNACLQKSKTTRKPDIEVEKKLAFSVENEPNVCTQNRAIKKEELATLAPCIEKNEIKSSYDPLFPQKKKEKEEKKLAGNFDNL